MNKCILVTYATRAGSTVEVAAAIGETLSLRGFAVDVKPAEDQPRLDGYQSVVIGSAIRMGNWLPEAIEFVKTNQQTLNRMPVALFTVHMLNIGDDLQSCTNRQAYLKNVRPLLQKSEEVYFAGKLDFSHLSFLDRSIAKMVKVQEEDRRDWDTIRSWAETITA